MTVNFQIIKLARSSHQMTHRTLTSSPLPATPALTAHYCHYPALDITILRNNRRGGRRERIEDGNGRGDGDANGRRNWRRNDNRSGDGYRGDGLKLTPTNILDTTTLTSPIFKNNRERDRRERDRWWQLSRSGIGSDYGRGDGYGRGRLNGRGWREAHGHHDFDISPPPFS